MPPRKHTIHRRSRRRSSTEDSSCEPTNAIMPSTSHEFHLNLVPVDLPQQKQTRLVRSQEAPKIAHSKPPNKSSKMPMFNRLEEALGQPPIRNSLIPTSFQPKQTQVEDSQRSPAKSPAVQTEAVQAKRVQPMKIPEAIEEEPEAVQESESLASDGSASKSKST